MFFAPGGYSSAFFNSLEKDRKAPVVLGAGCLKLRPLEKDRFRTVNGLDKMSENAVSFEFVRKPGWFIRSLNTELVIEKHIKDSEFEKDCSFFPMRDLWFPNFSAFESVQRAGYYLRQKDGRLVLQRYDGSIDFKEEASFKTGSNTRILCDGPYELNDESSENLSTAGGEKMGDCGDACSVVSFQMYENPFNNCESPVSENEMLNLKKAASRKVSWGDEKSRMSHQS